MIVRIDKQCEQLNPKNGIIIPAFNESYSIVDVVLQVKKSGQVIVIDDGSSDQTAELARTAGAYVISHENNLGYDKALETGLRTACELGCDFAVTIDADGQHKPDLVDVFLQELYDGAGLVVGCRDSTQRWSEELFCLIGVAFWSLKDPLCGMKGYRLDAICDIADINTYQSVGTELAIRLIKNGVSVSQPEVITRPRTGNSKFGGGLSANLRIVKAMITGIIKSNSYSTQN